MKRIAAMLLVVVLTFALATPVAAEAPARNWQSSTWTTLIGWLSGWTGGLGQVFAASTAVTEQTEAFPEMDPDGAQAYPGLDPNGSNAFPEMDPDGAQVYPGLDPDGSNAFPEMDPDG